MKRLAPKERKEKILEAATRLAMSSTNYAMITRAQVAKEANCTDALVTHYFKTVRRLRAETLIRAIELDNHKIIAQGVVNNDPLLNGVDTTAIRRAMESITP